MALPKKVITRQTFDCPIFGTPKDLPTNKLPTGEEIIRGCSQERFNLALRINNKSVSFKQVTSTVTNKVISLYEKASIPTVTETRITQLITALHDKYCGLRKSYTRDKNNVLKILLILSILLKNVLMILNKSAHFFLM